MDRNRQYLSKFPQPKSNSQVQQESADRISTVVGFLEDVTAFARKEAAEHKCAASQIQAFECVSPELLEVMQRLRANADIMQTKGRASSASYSSSSLVDEDNSSSSSSSSNSSSSGGGGGRSSVMASKINKESLFGLSGESHTAFVNTLSIVDNLYASTTVVRKKNDEEEEECDDVDSILSSRIQGISIHAASTTMNGMLMKCRWGDGIDAPNAYQNSQALSSLPDHVVHKYLHTIGVGLTANATAKRDERVAKQLKQKECNIEDSQAVRDILGSNPGCLVYDAIEQQWSVGLLASSADNANAKTKGTEYGN